MSSAGSFRVLQLLSFEDCGGCAHGGMSSSPSAWPWQRRRTTHPARCTPRTTPQGATQLPPRPERRDEEKQPRRQERSLLPGALPAVRRGRRRVGCAVCQRGRAVGVAGKGQQNGEQIFETFVLVPMLSGLDAPMSQMVDQLVGVLRLQFSACVEQVITAPKITVAKSCAQRSVLLVPQLAEELVEVPQISLQDCVVVGLSSGPKTSLGTR